MEGKRLAVLLFGGHGRFGLIFQAAASKHGWSVTAPPSNRVNFRDPTGLSHYLTKWMLRHQDGVVINAAAISSIDHCERDRWSCTIINYQAAIIIADFCRLARMSNFFISTDAVFSGRVANQWYRHAPADDPYREDRNLDMRAINEYGRTKARAEREMLLFDHTTTIIRPMWLFGQGSNFITDVLARAERGVPILGLTDYIGIPTYLPDLAAAMISLIEQPRQQKIYHLVSAGDPISRYDLARLVLAMDNHQGRVVATTQDELVGKHWAVRRPINSSLNNLGGPPLRPWCEALAEYLATVHSIPQTIPV